MIEDMELATVVRRALEESVTPAGRGSPAAIMALAAQEAARRRRVRCWRWGAGGLAAAVLAAILLLPLSRRLSGGAAGAGVEGVIAVLCEIDGLDLCGGTEASAGDRLLDWQDAPCRDLL